MTRRTYTVVFEHGDRPNQWVASVREVPQCHTFGRGLMQTRARIREALILWEGEKAEAAELREILPLSKSIRQDIARIGDLCRKIDEFAAEVRVVRESVMQSLDRWSMRDIGEVLELSHQRISQVAPARRKRKRSK